MDSSDTTKGAKASDPSDPPLPGLGQSPPAQVGASSSTASTSTTFTTTTTTTKISVPTRIRRRNRMITSCLECRRRKLKCDKSHPCINCNKARRECIFLSPSLDQASQLKLTEIKEKVGSLERLLEKDVARSAAASSLVPYLERALPDDADDDLPGAEDEKDLEPTPLAVGDAVYEDNGDNGDNDILDLGIQIGKMRINERIGGFFRPKISEELGYTLADDLGTDERLGLSPGAKKLSPSHTSSFLKPGSNYIAPASSFFFGPPLRQTSLIDFLPSRLAANRLVKQYFTAVYPIAQIMHRPSFENGYENFWEEISLGVEPSCSFQAIIFATMFSGVVSMDESIIWRDFGVAKDSLIDNFKLGTETALGRANFLRTTRVETLQAFVMYLISLCRNEISRAHSVLVGAAIRMAECMGLHRDGESYGLNPLETHVRRLVWYQLCFLDIRTCEAQGPRPTIHKDDFDTKFPLNIDDVDVHISGKLPSPADRWTDATFTLIRFELNEMVRTIWVDRPRIERRKISLTAVLTKIETFRRNMATKYDHLIDERISLHRCAKMVKSLLLARLHIMVLHRYHNSVAHNMPERLRQIMITSGTTMLENAVTLEVMPEFQLWKWYVGAYQQYHVAFLLLIEVFYYPQRKECDRIWPCLDYVFETNRAETRDTKARKILKELQEKTAVYQEKRKMRAPPSMDKVLSQRIKIEPARLQGILGFNSTTIGRAPLPDMVFAGISNGETLWALPNQASPENSSDTSSPLGQFDTSISGSSGGDDLMADIDWEAFDQMFPPDQASGDMKPPTFDLWNPSLYS